MRRLSVHGPLADFFEELAIEELGLLLGEGAASSECLRTENVNEATSLLNGLD